MFSWSQDASTIVCILGRWFTHSSSTRVVVSPMAGNYHFDWKILQRWEQVICTENFCIKIHSIYDIIKQMSRIGNSRVICISTENYFTHFHCFSKLICPYFHSFCSYSARCWYALHICTPPWGHQTLVLCQMSPCQTYSHRDMWWVRTSARNSGCIRDGC